MKQTRLPSLAALRAFEAVSRAGSMKEASNELHVTPGAISQLIRKLEDELSVKLFERKSRELTLTSEGKMLSAGAVGAFDILLSAVSNLPNENHLKSIVISCESTIASAWLAPRVASLLALDLDINIDMLVHHDADELSKQTFDLALTTQSFEHSNYESQYLGTDTFSAYGAPSYLNRFDEHTIEESRDLSVLHVDYSRDECAPSWQDWCNRLDVECCSRGTTFGRRFEQALAAAKAGAGLLLAPNALVSSDLRTNQLARYCNMKLASSRQYFLIHRKSSVDHATQLAKQWLDEQMRQSLINTNDQELQTILQNIVPIKPATSRNQTRALVTSF